jgi:hypothetical protein
MSLVSLLRLHVCTEPHLPGTETNTTIAVRAFMVADDARLLNPYRPSDPLQSEQRKTLRPRTSHLLLAHATK